MAIDLTDAQLAQIAAIVAENVPAPAVTDDQVSQVRDALDAAAAAIAHASSILAGAQTPPPQLTAEQAAPPAIAEPADVAGQAPPVESVPGA